MRIVTAAGVALALAALCTCAQTPAQTVPAEKADLVRGSGCVRSGVEAGCLVVTATQDKKDYNLFFSGAKPAAGMAISFEGTLHQGPTVCMQGTPVRVTTWSHIDTSCAAGR